jgi:hypothetical protein
MVKTKRQKRNLPSPTPSLSPTSLQSSSPTSPPARHIPMEESLAQLHAKFDSFGSQLAKIDTIEKSISTLIAENVTFREEIREKNKIIEQLSEKVNKLDQSLRSNSIRVHGLPITSCTSASHVPGIVYKEIILPIIDTAKQSGDIPPSYTPHIHSTLVNAFALPSKKSSTAPVVMKFYSEFIRNLVFNHRCTTIPTAPDPTSNLPNLLQHLFTPGPCMVSMYLSLAASTHLWQHVLTVHPWHIFTAGPCTMSLYLSLAASTHLWQHVLTCRMCILGIYSPLDHVR